MLKARLVFSVDSEDNVYTDWNGQFQKTGNNQNQVYSHSFFGRYSISLTQFFGNFKQFQVNNIPRRGSSLRLVADLR